MKGELWLFAYGSLLWKPGVEFDDQSAGRINGWSRRFWQGSPDHRGTLENPGRVVTLVPEHQRRVTGAVYRLSGQCHAATLRYLDHRESGGYQRCWVTVERERAPSVRALTYVALPGNPHYLGPASSDEIRSHILRSEGPSGKNIEYYQQLIASMSQLDLVRGEWSDILIDPGDLNSVG